MAGSTIRFNRRAFARILNSPGVQRLVDGQGEAIARRADSKYEGPRMSSGRKAMAQDYRATKGLHGSYGRRDGGRPVCYVHPHGILARRDEARNKTLERSLAGGG